MREEQHFSSSIWFFETPIEQNDCIKWALKYEKDIPRDSSKSNVGGYQSLSSNDFSEIPFFEVIKNSLHELPSFTFKNWWLNINRKGDYNRTHTHPFADVAGVYYITDNHEALTLINPLQHNRLWEDMVFNKPCHTKINAKPGDLILFPADIPHFVDPHNSHNPRISLSFNISFNFK